MPIGFRNGRVGILATLLLLFSIVLFLGSLFYLSVNGPWGGGGGTLFGGNLFKPATYTENVKETPISTEVEDEVNLTEAIDDLIKAGCVFVDYSGEYNEEETTQLDYQQFREEAIDRKIVQKAEISQDSTVLLVVKSGKTYSWSP